MPKLIRETPAAAEWVEHFRATSVPKTAFGRIAEAVVWVDDTAVDGMQLVPLDPAVLVEKINKTGMPLLRGHDPGFPLGKVLGAASFTSPDGRTFVAGVLGFYEGKQLSFRDFGIYETLTEASPAKLPIIPSGCWIDVVSDPREIEPAWIEDLVKTAPMPVRRADSSLNAADSAHELIRIGVVSLALLWNPFITAIGSEAGKATYAAMRDWLRRAFEKLGERKNPVLEIQIHEADCQISFMVRGNDVKRHYAALETLSGAASSALRLVARLKEAGVAPKLVTYEFHKQDQLWFPSFAELEDGRLVTDNKMLIAVEKLPSSLSLGLTMGDEQPLLPSIKEVK
jgi:hypothetical protein